MNTFYISFRGLPEHCRKSGDTAAFRTAVEFIMAQAGFESHGWVGIDEAVNDDSVVRRFAFGGDAGFQEAKRAAVEWFAVFGGMDIVSFGGTVKGLMHLDTF